MTSITLEQAKSVVAAAEHKADDIDVPMNIAVVDAGNNLTAFVRQDGAWLGSIEIAKDKAFTARAFDISTAELAEVAQPGGPLYGIAVSNEGRVIVFPGGIPLKHGRRGRRSDRRQRRRGRSRPRSRGGRRGRARRSAGLTRHRRVTRITTGVGSLLQAAGV